MIRLLPLLLLGYFFSCEKPTEPKTDPEPDTTSHNIIWRVDTLGTYLSTVRDVAIVNENNIWAVGEFYKKHSTFDSTTQDQYNLAHWDGTSWTLKKVFPQTQIDYKNGSTPTHAGQTKCIYAFNENEIWAFAQAGSYLHYNGSTWKTQFVPEINGEINKMWGSSGTNLYFVGNRGTILHYNGSTFTRIPYDETVDFIDIWGDESGTVRAVGRKRNTYVSELVKVAPGVPMVELSGLTQPIDSDRPDILLSIWWDQPGELFINADNGLFIKKGNRFDKIKSSYPLSSLIYTWVIRGNKPNDLIGAGGYSNIIHYNGKSIYFYKEISSTNPFSEFTSITIKGNTICAGGETSGKGGWDQSRALIALGKRI